MLSTRKSLFKVVRNLVKSANISYAVVNSNSATIGVHLDYGENKEIHIVETENGYDVSIFTVIPHYRGVEKEEIGYGFITDFALFVFNNMLELLCS